MWKIRKEPKRMTRKKITKYKTTFSRDGTNRRLDTAVEKVQLFDDVAIENSPNKTQREDTTKWMGSRYLWDIIE